MYNPFVTYDIAMRSYHMSMIIYPVFPINLEGCIFTTSPFCPIFTYENKPFIKNIFAYMIQNTRRTIIRIWSLYSIRLCNWFSPIIQNITDVSEFFCGVHIFKKVYLQWKFPTLSLVGLLGHHYYFQASHFRSIYFL